MSPDVSQLLKHLRSGDESALSQLASLLYPELHRIAASHLKGERSSHTLQATALVHEAYLKLAGERQQAFVDRPHFLAVASRVMRQVLVDYARARAAQKRGGAEGANSQQIELTPDVEAQSKEGLDQIEILELDRALDALAREDPALARLIEMRYFGGLTAEETAEVLVQSVHVVRHDMRLAQACLRRNLSR